MAAKPEELSRDFVVQQHGGLSGAPREHQIPRRRLRQGRARSHAEWIRTGGRADADCDPGELSAERWLDHHPPGAAALHGWPGCGREGKLLIRALLARGAAVLDIGGKFVRQI